MADGLGQASVRDERGRFVSGQSGNPAGKSPGTRNRASLLRAALDSEDGPAMARVIIDKAVAGDVVTARFCLDRLEPRPRGRAIAIDLPEGARAHDIVAAYDATVQAMMAGEITPDEAVQMTRVLDGRLRAIEAARREQARDERGNARKPSPSATGFTHLVRSSPLEGGEEKRPANAAVRGEGIDSRAAGSGPSRAGHLHLACISRSPPFTAGARERCEAGEGFTANLLHSTCIGSFPALSPALAAGGWVV